jgi:hypothetical protein
MGNNAKKVRLAIGKQAKATDLKKFSQQVKRVMASGAPTEKQVEALGFVDGQDDANKPYRFTSSVKIQPSSSEVVPQTPSVPTEHQMKALVHSAQIQRDLEEGKGQAVAPVAKKSDPNREALKAENIARYEAKKTLRRANKAAEKQAKRDNAN